MMNTQIYSEFITNIQGDKEDNDENDMENRRNSLIEKIEPLNFRKDWLNKNYRQVILAWTF